MNENTTALTPEERNQKLQAEIVAERLEIAKRVEAGHLTTAEAQHLTEKVWERWHRERLLCSCVVEDDGDGETGPHLSIVEAVVDCPLHGREADPEHWAEAEAWEDGYSISLTKSLGLVATLGPSGYGVYFRAGDRWLSDGYDDPDAALLAAGRALEEEQVEALGREADLDAERGDLNPRVDRGHRFPVGAIVHHVDAPDDLVEVGALTWRVRDGVAYPTYSLLDPAGDEVDDVLDTVDLVEAGELVDEEPEQTTECPRCGAVTNVAAMTYSGCPECRAANEEPEPDQDVIRVTLADEVDLIDPAFTPAWLELDRRRGTGKASTSVMMARFGYLSRVAGEALDELRAAGEAGDVALARAAARRLASVGVLLDAAERSGRLRWPPGAGDYDRYWEGRNDDD